MSVTSTASQRDYAAPFRPSRPGRKPQRSPVIKLGATEADHRNPGPGAYSPRNEVGRPSSAAWSLGARSARKSAVCSYHATPGPIYSMRSSIKQQSDSTRPSSARFGFGTEPQRTSLRIRARTPGPGAYTPRVTCSARRGDISTVRADIVDGASSKRATPGGGHGHAQGTSRSTTRAQRRGRGR